LSPKARDPAYLWDMLEAARHIRRFTEGLSLEQYLKDEKTRSAVERQLEILGEGRGKSLPHSSRLTLKFPGSGSPRNGMYWHTSMARSTISSFGRWW